GRESAPGLQSGHHGFGRREYQACAGSDGAEPGCGTLTDPFRATEPARGGETRRVLGPLPHKSCSQEFALSCRRGFERMSALGAVANPTNTLGPVPKTMRAGVYREKGIVR